MKAYKAVAYCTPQIVECEYEKMSTSSIWLIVDGKIRMERKISEYYKYCTNRDDAKQFLIDHFSERLIRAEKNTSVTREHLLIAESL